MVVFSEKNFNHTLSEGEIPATPYGMSDSGWMDQKLFATWLSTHFSSMLYEVDQLSYYWMATLCILHLQLVQTALQHDIIFCLPDRQPLDTSWFGPLKMYWSKSCHEFLFANPGCVITKFQFSKLFSQAWSNGMSINNPVSSLQGSIPLIPMPS